MLVHLGLVENQYHGDKVDVFALGVVLFVLTFEEYPFVDTDTDYQGASYLKYLNDKDKFWAKHDPEPALKELLDAMF